MTCPTLLSAITTHAPRGIWRQLEVCQNHCKVPHHYVQSVRQPRMKHEAKIGRYGDDDDKDDDE